MLQENCLFQSGMRTVNKESHLNPVTVTLLKSLFRALFWYMLVSWKIKQILMSSSSMLHLISWRHVPITSADWLPVLLKRVNGWMLFKPQMSNFSAISWREQLHSMRWWWYLLFKNILRFYHMGEQIFSHKCYVQCKRRILY